MARDFDGSTGYLSLADGDPLSLGIWTVSAWVNLDVVDTEAAIITHEYDGSDQMPMVLAMGAGGAEGALNRWFVGYWTGSAWRTASDSITAPTGSWVHLGGVYEGGTGTAAIKLYRDGALAASATPATANVASAAGKDLYIARSWHNPGLGGASFINGRIAEVGVWNVALSAAEVASLSKRYSPRLIRPQSLVSHWPLMGNASPEPDAWKHKYDLTLNGTGPKGDHPPIIVPSPAIYLP